MLSESACASRFRFALPVLATLALVALALRRSHESPVVFERYSVGYSIVLIFALFNVMLLWWRPPMPSVRAAASALVLLFSAAGLLDFVVGLQWIVIGPLHVIVVLAAGILVQAGLYDRLRNKLGPWKFHLSLRELALLAFSCMSAVVLSEVALRTLFLERLTPKTLTEFQSFMAGRWPRPIVLEKAVGTVRAAGLADSMGVVGGASENYYYVFEELLRNAGLPLEMMNISVSGNSPGHELTMLRLALAYAPDLVLHSFYVGNDFTLFAEDTYEVRGVRIDDWPGVNRFAPGQFFLTDFIRNTQISNRDARLRNEELQAGLVKQVGHLSRKAYFALEQSRLPLFDSSQRQVLSAVFPVLDAIRETAARGNAAYAMIINPEQIQVDETLRSEVLQTFNVNENMLDWDWPQQLLREYCESRGIPCLDLLPLFRATDRTGRLYTIRDGHYSAAGNQTAARAVADFVVLNKLIGDSTDR